MTFIQRIFGIICALYATIGIVDPVLANDEKQVLSSPREDELIRLTLTDQLYEEYSDEYFDVYRLGGAVYVCINPEMPFQTDNTVPERILTVIREDNILSWDGFHCIDPNVLDGGWFNLAFEFGDGTKVTADGDNCFPDGYYDTVAKILRIIRSAPVEKEVQLPGGYVYEDAELGSAFTINIDEDGTFSFSDGTLSGDDGNGTWRQEGKYLYMSGNENEYAFLIGDGVLAYYEEYSDTLPVNSVPDGALFIR